MAYLPKVLLTIVGLCTVILIWAGIAYECWGLGFTESLQFIVKCKLSTHRKKAKLKRGDIILLTTKYGIYPTKVIENYKFSKTIVIEADPWMDWTRWNYDDIELLDTATKRLLYGDD